MKAPTTEPVVQPLKRGRPPVYATKKERDAAHAALKREAREQKRLRREQRRLSRCGTQAPVINWELTLKMAVESGAPQWLIEGLQEEVERERDMQEYDRDEARERQRDQKRNVVTVEDIKRGAWMKRGIFPTDAPQGEGFIVTGKDVVRISDVQQSREFGTGGGKRVAPKGHGLHSHEDVDFKKQAEETESQWADKHFPKSKLQCHSTFRGRKCPFEVVGLLPQDAPGDNWRFHCYYHSPIHDFRGRVSTDSPKECLGEE